MEDTMGDVNLAQLTKPNLIEKVETARNIWKADQEAIRNLNHQNADLQDHIKKLEKSLATQGEAIVAYHEFLEDLLTSAAVAARHTADIKTKLKPYAKAE